MFQYHCLNPIAEKGLGLFDEEYKKSEDLQECDAVLVRSAKMHDMELPESVKVIARAGAGVNNIPVKDCAEKGVVVFNTPGANANGVKELVLAGMLLASRDIVGGIEWVAKEKDQEDIDKLAEKQKKQLIARMLDLKKENLTDGEEYAELSQKSKSLQDIIDKWRPIYLERMEMVKSVSIQKRKRNNKK